MNVKCGANLDWAALDCMKSGHCFTTWNSSLNGTETKDSITEWDVTKIFEEYSSLGYKSVYVEANSGEKISGS